MENRIKEMTSKDLPKSWQDKGFFTAYSLFRTNFVVAPPHSTDWQRPRRRSDEGKIAILIAGCPLCSPAPWHSLTETPAKGRRVQPLS